MASPGLRVFAATASAFAAIGAFVVFALYGLLGAFSCHGSDAGSGVTPGSFGDTMCGLPLLVLFGAAAVVGVGAPVRYGAENRLSLGITISAGALSALALVYHGLFGSGWNAHLFVGLPLLVFVAGVVWTMRRTA